MGSHVLPVVAAHLRCRGTNFPNTRQRASHLGAALLALAALLPLGLSGSPATAQTVRIVTSVAGVTSTVSGNGGLAAQASINLSDAIAADSAGNIYIADTLNQQIRKISASTGIITAVAGTGQAGYSGDGQLAINAQLDSPEDVAVDAAGNLYIADTNNYLIRKVNAATGIITTIAGTPQSGGYFGDQGQATKALLNSPEDVAVDASGNVYISDVNNGVIREVTEATGIITTVAGATVNAANPGDGGPATQALISPSGIAVDADGNIYFADMAHCAIRKVMAATGIISDYAGSDKCGDSGDGGPAVSAELGQPLGKVSFDSAGNLYIADYSNNAIRKVTASTGIITTIAGDGNFGFSGDGGPATHAALNNPEGVAATVNGSVFIVDRQNLRIREIASDGIISTLAGNGTIGPVGSGVSATAAPLGINGYRWFNSVYADGAGDFYFADDLNNVIRKVTPAGIVSTIAGTGVAGYSGDGAAATSAMLNQPDALAFDSKGNLYIAEDGNNVIRKVNAATGIITTYAGTYSQLESGGQFLGVTGDGGPATSAGLPEPTGLAFDSADNLYIAEMDQCVVRKVTPAGIISTYAGQATSCFFGQGSDGDGGPAASASLTFYAGSIAIDAQGNLYIGDGAGVRKVTASTGIITTVAGNVSTPNLAADSGDGGSALSAHFSEIYGVNLDTAGNLYVADTFAIREINSSNIISTIAGQDDKVGYSGDGGLATSALISPEGIAVDAAGNIYFSDSFGNRIRKVSTAASTQPAAATPAFSPAAGNYGASQTVSISSSTPGAQIFYTLDGSAPNPGTSPLYSGPLSLVGSVNLSAIAIAPGHSTSGTAAGSFTIGLPSQTITFQALADVNYGASPITLTATASSHLPVTYTVIGPATLSGSTLTITGAGLVTVTAKQAGDNNYAAAAPVSQTFAVNKAILTVTANDATIALGQAIPTFSYTITGFVNGDTASVVSGTANESTTATSTSPAGTYPIRFSTQGLSAANYFLNYVDGTLTITAATGPVVVLSPASLSFAPQGAGSTSASQTVTLTNSGSAALSVSGINIVSASSAFAETNTCGTSVAAGTKCSISVTFAPTTGGLVDGYISITDNAGNSPQTLALNGTGSDVSVSTTSTGMSIASGGGTSTAAIQIGSAGGFSGAVNLTCSVAYQGSGTPQDVPTCTLNPAQAQISSGVPANTTLTINTTASGGTARLNDNWLPMGGSALAALFLFIGTPRRRWRKLGLLVMLAALTLGIGIGCGGGSTSGMGGGTISPGTTAGNYMITVTATSGASPTETTSITIPLSVQ